MDNIERCRLCNNEKFLCGSHIIPKGLLKIAKGKHPQLISLPRDKDEQPFLDNVNWNENLLCSDCEAHLNLSYETTQIAVLKKKKIEHHDRYTITEFNFERFYLFWISILWRASESSLPMFREVQFSVELRELLRVTLLDGSLGGSKDQLPNLLQVGVSRWEWEEQDTRSVITSFITRPYGESICYMFLIAGLAVVYQLSGKPNQPLPEGFSLVKKTFSFRMNILNPRRSRFLDELLKAAMESAGRHSEFRE